MPASPGHFSGLCTKDPSVSTTTGVEGTADATDGDCAGSSPPVNPCISAVVVCDDTNATIVTGPLGVRSGSAKALGSVVRVKDCFEHRPDLGNSFPHWKAQSYGLVPPGVQQGQAPARPNMMDPSQNFPLCFGSWAGGMLVNASQNPGDGVDLKSLKFDDAGSVVVHVMADFEWGGVQFKVAEGSGNAEKLPNGDTALRFEYGGWQQSRTASLNGGIGNRYYMEGSAEFLDSVGEWYFDRATRMLHIGVTATQAAQAVGSPPPPPQSEEQESPLPARVPC